MGYGRLEASLAARSGMASIACGVWLSAEVWALYGLSRCLCIVLGWPMAGGVGKVARVSEYCGLFRCSDAVPGLLIDEGVGIVEEE